MENQYNFRDEEKCFAMQIENILRGLFAGVAGYFRQDFVDFIIHNNFFSCLKYKFSSHTKK